MPFAGLEIDFLEKAGEYRDYKSAIMESVHRASPVISHAIAHVKESTLGSVELSLDCATLPEEMIRVAIEKRGEWLMPTARVWLMDDEEDCIAFLHCFDTAEEYEQYQKLLLMARDPVPFKYW